MTKMDFFAPSLLFLFYRNLLSLSCHSTFQQISGASVHLFEVYLFAEKANLSRRTSMGNSWEEQPGVISVVTEETRCDKKEDINLPIHNLSVLFFSYLYLHKDGCDTGVLEAVGPHL